MAALVPLFATAVVLCVIAALLLYLADWFGNGPLR